MYVYKVKHSVRKTDDVALSLNSCRGVQKSNFELMTDLNIEFRHCVELVEGTPE